MKIYHYTRRSSGHAQSETVDNEGETTKTLSDSDSVTSIADEPSKLAQLRDQGVITETEFVQMKGNLIENIDACLHLRVL